MKDKPLEAVRVRFSCGHAGGVWPEASQAGTAHLCLVCRETVTVTGTAANVAELRSAKRDKTAR